MSQELTNSAQAGFIMGDQAQIQDGPQLGVTPRDGARCLSPECVLCSSCLKGGGQPVMLGTKLKSTRTPWVRPLARAAVWCDSEGQ